MLTDAPSVSQLALRNSREMPARPKTSFRSLRKGTLVVNNHRLAPEESITCSSWSISGCPDRMIFCSSVKNCSASSAGWRSKSVLPIKSVEFRKSDLLSGGGVRDDEAACRVLDPDIVGKPVNQRLQRNDFV